MKIGILGYGFAGRGFHARLIARVPELQLAAVATRSEERQAQAKADGVPAVFSTLADMLPHVDLVVLATPHDTHRDEALAVMRAGKHVVIDKPMCLSSADADRLLEARDEAGVLLSVFHNRRWDWDYLTVRHALAQGWLGEPYLVEATVLRYKAPRGWRADAETGGGLIWDWGAHLVDQALQLVPAPLVDVSCEVQRRKWGAGAGSFARLQLRFENGVLYAIEIGNLATILKPRWFILGEDGALRKEGLDPQEPALLGGFEPGEKPEERALIKTLDDERVIDSLRGDWADYYRNVAEAVAGRAPLAVTAEQGRQVVAVLEAATRSADDHRPVVPR
ncbi:MAG: iolW 1 [Cyanobacteria bacterium RYN_339]|nr:iolW 1 [Cyanobacteria bacterium RYN_339]